MRGDNQLMNIRYNDGQFSRIPRTAAEKVVNAGRAQYVNNTTYRAHQAGITIKPGEDEASIRTRIKESRSKKKVEEKKVEERRRAEQLRAAAETAEDDHHQALAKKRNKKVKEHAKS